MNAHRPSPRTRPTRPSGRLLTALCLFAALAGACKPSTSAAAPAGTSSMGEFPDHWYFYATGRPAYLREMEGKRAPEIAIREWYGEPFDLESLKGKIVVVDFWGTWCMPCVRALPENVAMARKYAERDVVVLGVHDARQGWNRVGQVDEQVGLNYPIGLDVGSSARNWRVSFWPTYAVLDREGIVRAIGLLPTHVDRVVERLLAADPPKVKPADGTVPDGPGADAGEPVVVDDRLFDPMLEGEPDERARFEPLLRADAPPALSAGQWLNAEAMDLASLRGKVVLLDFWATWCKPCIDNIPKLNALHDEYGDRGLVIIGVCHPEGAERMAAVVRSHKIDYPVCADERGATGRDYLVDSYPDYYLIDRSGRLRVADVANNRIEDAVKLLLGESPPNGAAAKR